MNWEQEEARALAWLQDNNFRSGKLPGFSLHEPCGVLIYGDADRTDLLKDHLIWCPYKQIELKKVQEVWAAKHNHLAHYACHFGCPEYISHAEDLG